MTKGWLTALWMGMSMVRGWDISTVDVSRVDTPLGANQELVKTWTIAGDQALKYLHVYLPGRVFVEVEEATSESKPTVAPLTGSKSNSEEKEVEVEAQGSGRNVANVAQVVLSGTSEEVLNQIEVVSTKKTKYDADEDDEEDEDDEGDAHEAIKVHYRNERFDGAGYVLVRVVLLHKHKLQGLDMFASADIVLGQDVLVQNDPTKHVSLRSHGSGDLFLPTSTEAYTMGSLALVVTGSTSLQYQAKSLSVNGRLSVKVSGSGTVAVVADQVTVADTLSSVITGSGTAILQAAKLTTQNITTDIAGSGDITYSRAGTCKHHEIGVAGSGTVSAGSLVCEDTQVDVIGSGSVLVQTTRRLHTSSVMSGSIHYYGPAPKEISSEGEFLLGGDPKGTVKPAAVNKFREADLNTVPPREPVHVVLHYRRAWFSSEPRGHSWFRIGNKQVGDNVLLTTWLQRQQRERDDICGVVVTVASVATACAVATIATRAYKAYVRRQYELVA